MCPLTHGGSLFVPQVIVARDAKIKELMDILGGMEDNYHDPRDLAPFLQKAGGSLCDQFNQSLNTLSEICYCLEGDPALARGFQEQLPDPVELPESPTLWGMGEALQQVTRCCMPPSPPTHPCPTHALTEGSLRNPFFFGLWTALKDREAPPPAAANHQLPPTANHQPPPTMVEHMSYTRSFAKMQFWNVFPR